MAVKRACVSWDLEPQWDIDNVCSSKQERAGVYKKIKSVLFRTNSCRLSGVLTNWREEKGHH